MITDTLPAKRVPSLVWVCSRVLARYADQIPIEVLRNYDERSDILCGALDPALCATLVQVYDNLPPQLHSLTLPLAHPHIPLLQSIPHTSLFSLITILDLPACPQLTDSSIVHLSALHSLVALDASATSLSSYAIKILAGALLWVDEGPRRRGPWALRILRLRFCQNVDDTVYDHLTKFPLLTAIDLRGTNCQPPQAILPSFQPSQRTELFHPAPLSLALEALSHADVHSSKNHLKLIIDSLGHSTLSVFKGHPFLQGLKSSQNLKQNKSGLIPVGSKCSSSHRSSSTDDLNIRGVRNDCSEQQQEQHLSSLEPAVHISNFTFESDPSTFYSQGEPSHRPIKYDLLNDYEAKTYYKWAHLESVARPAAPHDEQLALYCIPPTWTALEECSTSLLNQMHARSTHQRVASLVPAINRTQRTFQIGQARIEALRESASTRRRSSLGLTICLPGNASNEVSSPGRVLGKNPFRRQSLPHGKGLSDPNRVIKSLKPISAMEVPELPLNMQDTATMVDMAENTQNRPNLTANTGMKLDPSLLVTTSGSRSRLVGFDSAWSGSNHETSAKKPFGRGAAKKARVENGAGGKKANKGGVVMKNGFDWSAWGAK